jgi:S-formylglutathione hydrolase
MLPGWQSTLIAGKHADFFSASPARSALIYLHGVGQETLADKPRYTQLLGQLQLNCVCPRGDLAWWSNRPCSSFDPKITAEHFVVSSVRQWVQATWGMGPRAIGLFGISMGGQGALRMAFKFPSLFPVVAAIAPAIDYHQEYGRGGPLDEMYDSKEQCRQDTALMHIHPSEQPPHIFFCCDPDDERWYRGCDRLHEKLSALGVRHECDLQSRAGGHTWDYYNQVAEPTLKFVSTALDHEGRRLL